MENGKRERLLINAAVKKLGHPYSNPSDKIALLFLRDYISEPVSKTKKGRRSQMADAASKVMKMEIETKAKRTSIKTVRNRTKKNSSKPDAFYKSWAWKKVRYNALRIHGQRCQCCGWRPGDTSHGYLVVDHIKPRSKHPKLELEVSNLQIMCNDCNMGKSNIYTDDFRGLDSWLVGICNE